MVDESRRIELIEELTSWRHNRRLYPGWLIAPYQTRDAIWFKTKGWLSCIEQALNEWSSPELVVLLQEVFWRLNICLQLPPGSIIDRVPAVLDALETKIQDRVDVSSFFVSDWPVELTPSTKETRDSWVYSMIQVVRNMRVKQDKENFEKSILAITSLGECTNDHLATVSYEQCLFALAEADHKATREHLDKWPSSTEDPYWLVRRAAIFVELGEVSEARTLVEKTLDRLKQMRSPDGQNFWIVSREGWCLKFLRELGMASGDISSNMHRDRERELEAFRSSPTVELDHLVERVKNRPVPQEPWITQEQPGFDEGGRSRTMHFGSASSHERLAPAINLIIATEVSGVPPIIGNASFFSSEYVQALQWIPTDFASLWASLILRYNGIGIDKKTISRTTLSNLPGFQVECLFSASALRLEQSIADIQNKEAAKNSPHPRKDPFSVAKHMGDFASRLSFRLGNDERKWLLNIAMKAAKNDLFHHHPSGNELISNLLQRTIPFLKVNDLQDCLPELIGFPLCGEVKDEYWWPEPFWWFFDVVAETPKLIRNTDTETAISGLIDYIGSENVRLRSSAILRLAHLQDLNLLSDVHTKKLAESLWNDADEYDLPKISPQIYKSVFLEFPEFISGKAVDGLLRWLKEIEMEKRFSWTTPELDKPEERKRSLSVRDPDIFLVNLLAIDQVSRKKGMDENIFFTVECREEYLENILSWWRDEREEFSSWSKESVHIHSAFDRIDSVLNVLVTCVVGSNVPTAKQQKPLSDMLEDMKRMGAQMETATLIELALNPEKYYARCVTQLRRGLLNNVPDKAYRNVNTCWYWGTNADRLSIPKLPDDVYITIFTLIGGVIQPAAQALMNLLTDLIKEGLFPHTDRLRHLLSDAIDEASCVLSYSCDDEEIISRPIDHEELPHLRRSLIKLMLIMKKNEISMGLEGNNWLKATENDPFIDISHIGKLMRQ